jgi:hypothetical protein
LPETVRLVHSVEEVKRVLSVLEAVEFRWTIQQVLDTPESWLDDVLTMKATGEKWKQIRALEQGEGNTDG